MDDDVHLALTAVALAMRDAVRPWWVIGSAAVALHGAEAGGVGDIDVLVDRADMDPLLARLGIGASAMEAHPLFRSEVFARWTGTAVAVEFMAGFAVACDGVWQAVAPRSRVPISVGDALVYVPERGELIALLRWIGRPKDAIRASALEGRKPG